jgi:hypothetical protein
MQTEGKRRAARTVAGAVCLAFAACVAPPPQIPAESTATASPTFTPTPPPPPIVVARTGATLDPWQNVAAQLEAENRQLTTERNYWKGEADRYQQGLQRAVDKLNEVAGAAAASQYAAAHQPAPPTAPVGRAEFGTDAAQIQLMLEFATVMGNVYSYTSRDLHGQLVVELLRNGQVIGTQTQRLDLPAGSTQAYAVQFPMQSGGTGTFSGRARPIIGP